MTTTRCTPVERKPFQPAKSYERDSAQQFGEPALGSVAERLDIIYARLGRGRWPLKITMSPAERREYARWCASEGLDNPFERSA